VTRRTTLSPITEPLSAVTSPELCHFTGLSDKSSSDYLPSRTTLPVETLPTTLQELWNWASRHTEQLFQRLYYLPSDEATRPADTLCSDFPRALSRGGSSVYLQSDSLTEQIICRPTLPVVVLLETSPELYICHQPGSNSISAHYATYLPIFY
jgi:hypothetical protein